MNSHAKHHYDNAVRCVEGARRYIEDDEPDAWSIAKVCALLATAEIEIAKFCVANPTLIVGIDEDSVPDAPQRVNSLGGVWGA